MYSGNYPGTFVAPKNARNAETKRQSGAVRIPLLALSASMTSAYSSLGVSRDSNPHLSYLRRWSNHSATSAVCGAGYIDEPKRESYLPDSVHGSQRHLSALAKNALVLVSEYGCPHVFLTLTCNPEWPKIQSQLINGQTTFNRPDVTVPVFKPRLDKFKTNIRNGKCFKSRQVIYIIHVIEYQYCGLPHAHMVFHLDNAPDIDDNNQDNLIDFVDRNFIAELP